MSQAAGTGPVPLVVAPLPPPAEPIRQAPRPGFFRRRRVWLVVLALLLAGGAAIARLAARGAGGAIDQALLATVKRADLDVVVLETGRISPLLETQIKSKVGGQVIEVLVNEGARVRRGQPLLKVDPIEHQRNVARMEAEIALNREALAFAISQLGRAERAQAVAVAAAEELDKARHEAALGRARLKAAEVGLATARDQLRYTDVDAPFDGTVIQRNVQPGEVVVPGMTATVEGRPLMVLADMSVLLVKTDLNQIDVARVQVGQTAEVTLDALPGKKFSARVTRVAAAAANVGGRDLFPVEAALERPGSGGAGAADLGAIKPGMTADVRILVERKPRVLVLPIEAVASERGKSLVHVVAAAPGQQQGGAGRQRTSERTVTVGARNDREIELLTGVKEGEQVVIKAPSAVDVTN